MIKRLPTKQMKVIYKQIKTVTETYSAVKNRPCLRTSRCTDSVTSAAKSGDRVIAKICFMHLDRHRSDSDQKGFNEAMPRLPHIAILTSQQDHADYS